ncbi:hypothetical protein ACLQ2Q_01220 [Microbacterium sp. DT81.1]|uniref:hypothetical protein n=1 Tax=Microbacterium sp. DT81.1 TaxID=3393413 RepID=UPI003CF50669
MDTTICLLLVVAAMVLAVWQVPKHTAVSPIDEYVYIDYLAKVPTQFVVQRGEDTGQYARLYLSCHGVRAIGLYPQSMCTDWQPSDVDRMPQAGKTTADIYTPLYFAATWLMAQPLRLVGVEDLTTAGRLAGWTWLAAAAVLLYLSLRRLRVHPVVAGGLGLLLVGSLPAYWSNTYVSTDATALLAGSLMLFGVTMLLRPGAGRGARWLFVLFALLVTLAKMQNLMAVVAAAMVLVILAAGAAFRRERGRRLHTFVRDHHVHTAVLAFLVALAGQAAWLVIRNAIALESGAYEGAPSPLTATALLREMFKFFPGVSVGALDPEDVGVAAIVASTVMTWVIVAGVLGLLAVARRGSTDEALALSSFVVALLAAPFLALASTVLSGYYVDLVARYGMSLLPFFLACAGVLFTRSIWTRSLAPAVGVLSYGAMLSLTG